MNLRVSKGVGYEEHQIGLFITLHVDRFTHSVVNEFTTL